MNLPGINTNFARTAFTGLLVCLLTTPLLAFSSQDKLSKEHWGEWQALDSGYLGRAKQPPGMKRAVAERRLTAKASRLRSEKKRSAAGPRAKQRRDSKAQSGAVVYTTAALKPAKSGHGQRAGKG